MTTLLAVFFVVLQLVPLPSTLATVPTSLTSTNINKQLGSSRRFSRTRSHKDDDAASQGSGHSSASRFVHINVNASAYVAHICCILVNFSVPQDAQQPSIGNMMCT